MLKLLKPANPEDLFIQRYDVLMGWALALTNRNRAQAEDLVHDNHVMNGYSLECAYLSALWYGVVG
ncbi:MAG TPA: hypothetical protein VJ023_17455 [Pyrinomonadaceae bacterium]|nr:hypothetical protein [Pyrinomonadaceae bacterium]